MKRDTGIDITRIIAFVSVIGVHFFLNIGFYDRSINCSRMYLMVLLRTFFMICVPLFLLITGYLMSEKEIRIERKSLLPFYAKLSKVIILYILSELTVVMIVSGYNGKSLPLMKTILAILSFSGGYSWYVEMYIGLFLMIPFLNLIWHKCGNKEGRKAVVAVFLLITTASSIVNVFDLSTFDTLIHPWTSRDYTGLLPEWWAFLYPVTYYYIGAFIKKDVNVKELKSAKLLAILLLTTVAFSAFNIWRCYSIRFIKGPWQAWGSFENVINATLVFLLINSIDYEKIPERIRNGLGKVAGLTFSAYLLSKAPDTILYEKLIEAVPKITMRLNYFPLMFITNITISLILAAIVQLIYRLIMIVYRELLCKKKEQAA